MYSLEKVFVHSTPRMHYSSSLFVRPSQIIQAVHESEPAMIPQSTAPFPESKTVDMQKIQLFSFKKLQKKCLDIQKHFVTQMTRRRFGRRKIYQWILLDIWVRFNLNSFHHW